MAEILTELCVKDNVYLFTTPVFECFDLCPGVGKKMEWIWTKNLRASSFVQQQQQHQRAQLIPTNH